MRNQHAFVFSALLFFIVLGGCSPIGPMQRLGCGPRKSQPWLAGATAPPAAVPAVAPMARPPPTAEILAAGETALKAAVAIRSRMGAGAADLLLPLSIAARAELYYCAARANRRGAGAFDGESTESLVKRSTELNRDAVAKLEAAGFGQVESSVVSREDEEPNFETLLASATRPV